MPKRRSRKKVVKYRKSIFRPNIGNITFSVILLYIIISVIISLGKDSISTYQVTGDGSIMEKSIKATALILRDETIISTDKAGYLNYYIKDGERVAKHSAVYSLDETGTISDYLSQLTQEDTSGLKKNYTELKSTITDFKANYDPNSFGSVYDFKYDFNNRILELTNESTMSQLDEYLKENGSAQNFEKVYSGQSGIVSYTMDGYEDLKVEEITKEKMDTSKYNKKQLKTGELIAQSAPVYKIVSNENWNVIVPITKEQLAALNDSDPKRTTVPLHLMKDKLTVNSPFTVITNGEENYLQCNLKSYLANYLNERFLEVKIDLRKETGLKIPNTAVVKKTFYKIPVAYLSKGGNDTSSAFNIRQLNKKGDTIVKQVQPDIFYKSTSYCYIEMESDNPDVTITNGTILVANDSNKTYQVSETKALFGVYCVNRGYVDFKVINRLYRNEDYSIVSDNFDYSIALYDHIILNSETVKEHQKLY